MGFSDEAGDDRSGRRAYRSPLRAESAARTRTLIRESATELFAERGFVSTTVRQIAQHAGVAPRTVAMAFPNKAALFEEALRVATVGDEDPTPTGDRPGFLAILDEPDSRRLLHGVAGNHMDQLDRCGQLLLRCHETSGFDEDMHRIRERREESVMANCAAIAGALAERGSLHPSLSRREATDVLFALADPGIHHRLRRIRRWSKSQYLGWATDLLIHSLLAPRYYEEPAPARIEQGGPRRKVGNSATWKGAARPV